jgi:hypothetical protein
MKSNSVEINQVSNNPYQSQSSSGLSTSLKPIKEENPKPVMKPMSFKPFSSVDDSQYRDKYGFQHDDISLADAFNLEQIRFKDGSLPEPNFQQASL